MTIRVACPSCAKQFRLADSAARKIRCNACGSVIVVDGAASTNRTSQPRSDRPDSTNVAAVKSVAIRERAVGHSPAARVAEGRRAVPPSHSQKRTNGLFSLSTCLIGIGVSLLAVTAIAVAMVWPRGNIAAVPQVAERPEIPAASAIDREPAAKIVAATGTAAEDPRPEKPAAKQPRTESPPAPVDAAKPPVSAKAIKFRNIETAAVVDRTGMPVGTLFETRMIAAAKLNWVERSRIAQVIAEQNLQAFFGADAGAQRAALARTLKADVLAMVRSRTERSPENPAKLNKVVNLVVFESQRGLRLAAATIPASDNAEKDADALAAIFAGAMEKLSEKITHVFAVPGFVSQDFDYRYRYLTGAFSLHVERHLQHRKGLLLVELAEAKSLAAEVAVAGDAIDRQLPFYLLGEYRNDGAGDALRMKFTLKVQRGDAIVATRTREGIKAADVPNAVLAMADEVVDQALACKIATPHVVPDRAVEIKQLGERAITFQRNGEWVQCVEMLEAAFLLDPNQLEMRRRACQVYSMIAHLHRGRAQHNMTEAMLSMEAYRRALEHLEVGYRPTKNLEPPRVPGSRPWMDPFPGDEFLNASINMRDYRGFVPESEAFARHYQDLLDFERRIILDMVRARARAGYGDEFRFLGFILYRATPEQQVQIVRSLVQELKDLPMAKERTIS
ncbi:MAG TPA: hypothetical protein VHR72_15080, partial [Gemmataceae bacterium]|nr:hypothetical protein [Gemmataceae bacterium]